MKQEVYILWTTGDAVTAKNMVLMYAQNSMLRGWWDAVTVIIWGAAAALAAGDAQVIEKMELAAHAGVTFTACSACCANLGVTEQLKAQNVDVRPWGEPLTNLLKEGKPLITI